MKLEKQKSSPISPLKFRLRLALYWGVLGHLTLWLVLVLSIIYSLQKISIQVFYEPLQIVYFLLCALTGFFVLPRFITNGKRAKRRAFYGGMLSFALALFCAMFFYFLTSYLNIEGLNILRAFGVKMIYATAALIAITLSPLGGLFGWLAQSSFKKPQQWPPEKNIRRDRMARVIYSERSLPPKTKTATERLFTKDIFQENNGPQVYNEGEENNGGEPTFLLPLIVGLSWGLTVYAAFELTALYLGPYTKVSSEDYLNLIVRGETFASFVYGIAAALFLPKHLKSTSYVPSLAFTRGALLGGLIFILTPLVSLIITAVITLDETVITAFLNLLSGLIGDLPLLGFGLALSLICGLITYVTYQSLYFSIFKVWFWKEADISPPPERAMQETGNLSK